MSFSSQEDEHQPNVQDDFYTFLGVDRKATDAEITNAYRRLSRMFHPDKHKGDKTDAANILFDRTKKAYEVLKDPYKRAIYDTLGEKALNDEELYAVVKQDRTPEEIRASYKRLMESNEEKRLKELLSPRSSVTLGMDATRLFKPPTRRTRNLPKVRLSSMAVTAAIDLPVRDQNKLTLTGLVSSRNNKGIHAFTGCLSHPFSDTMHGELTLVASKQCAVKGKLVKHLSHQDIVSTSLGFDPHSFGFYLKELNYVRLLSHHMSFKTELKNHMNGESSLATTLTYAKDKNKLEFEFSMGIEVKSNYLSVSYMRILEVNNTKLRTQIRYELLGETCVEYGCDTSLTKSSTVGATVSIGSMSGVSVKLTAMVSSQLYALDIQLNDELTFAPVVYGSIGPVLIYACVKKYIVTPYQESLKKQKKRDSERDRTRKMNEKRAEADLTTSLMAETYRRSVANEESREDGLLIDVAIYGHADNLIEFVNSSVKNVPSEHLLLSDDELSVKQLILVTVPVQCLVRDSVLSLPDGRKSNLPGFFDPCPNHEKRLYCRYKHGQTLHEVFCSDNSRLRLPQL